MSACGRVAPRFQSHDFTVVCFMFQDMQTANHEVIIFFAGGKVCKEMTYPEFEAVLDNVVGLVDFADESVQLAYLNVSARLKITHCVLFEVRFDRQGNADKSWNIPLRHLAETASLGPDLGAGPIKLACRSQCPVSWYTEMLWDPDMSPQNSTFSHLREVISENRLHLPVVDSAVPGERMQMFVGGQGAGLVWPQVAGMMEPMGEIPFDPTLYGAALLAASTGEISGEHRSRLASLLKSQRLHIHTLQTESEQKLAELRLSAQKEAQTAELEIARLRAQHESLHSQNMALREQNEAQRRQLEALARTREIEVQQVQQQGKDALQQLKAQSDEWLTQRIAEETAKLREDIELRNMELMHRHEVARQLREELCQLRKDKLRLLNQGADKFLERMESLGLSFIAFHPGAGHISVALKDMPEYMENPTAFAANKCLVTEDHYRRWLAHYQSPTCQAPLTHDRSCGCKIPRVDVPSRFVSGESDRCERHTSRHVHDNVVSFRS
ncbi:Conserved hypothetical protein [gamma proteobacterium HdN1]|nr:Conserved hypothetical protein [gamma proteobacterium HdN1]